MISPTQPPPLQTHKNTKPTKVQKVQKYLRWATLLATLLIVGISAFPISNAFGEEGPFNMARNGTVGIQNESERRLFWSLLCTCGCPRETLGTCTCGFAHERRAELRAELAKGKNIEQIQDEYVGRFGSVALAVPPNKGSQRAVWLVPLLAIVAGAGLVGFILRRWVKTSKNAPAPDQETGNEAVSAEDEKKYESRLDDELKALDKE